MAGFVILGTNEPDFYRGSATGIPRNEVNIVTTLLTRIKVRNITKSKKGIVVMSCPLHCKPVTSILCGGGGGGGC